MATPQEELEALRAQVAALTARVHRLEQGTGIEPPAVRAPVIPPATAAAPPPPPPTPPIQHKPLVPGPAFLTKPIVSAGRDTEELEGKIGKLWLNRIGIVAILAGV